MASKLYNYKVKQGRKKLHDFYALSAMTREEVIKIVQNNPKFKNISEKDVKIITSVQEVE